MPDALGLAASLGVARELVKHGRNGPGPGRYAAAMSAAPVIVSACLLGVDCTYRGGNEARARVADALAGRVLLPVCPEVEGGLGVPRPRAEVDGGDGAAVLDGSARVRTAAGEDVTAAYVEGAHAVLRLALAEGVHLAVLKSRSPSCGGSGIYDGTHRRVIFPEGVGVTAVLLRRNGIEVVDEDRPDLAGLGSGGRDGAG